MVLTIVRIRLLYLFVCRMWLTPVVYWISAIQLLRNWCRKEKRCWKLWVQASPETSWNQAFQDILVSFCCHYHVYEKAEAWFWISSGGGCVLLLGTMIEGSLKKFELDVLSLLSTARWTMQMWAQLICIFVLLFSKEICCLFRLCERKRRRSGAIEACPKVMKHVS